MSAFADLHEVVNRLSGGNSGNPEFLNMHKEPRVASAAAATPIAGQPISLWEYEGQPSHGAVPGTTVAYPDNTTQGGWKQTDPSGGRQKWMTAFGGVVGTPGTLVLYDRLAHISGLSGTVTTAQTVSASAITRYTNGSGNFIAYEIYTQIGATGTTITADYTDDSGNSGQTSQATTIGATNNREAQRLHLMSLAAGDIGVRAVNTVTVLATTGTAGNFGIIIGHVLGMLTIPVAAAADIRSFMDGAMPEILTDACLAWYFVPQATTAVVADVWHVSAER